MMASWIIWFQIEYGEWNRRSVGMIHIFFVSLQIGALEKLIPEFYVKNSSIKHNFKIIKDFANRSFDPAVNLSILIFDIQSIESTQKK